MISALLMAAEFGMSDTHDHADVFVAARLMGVGLPPRYPGHIADGTVWDINSTCAEFVLLASLA